MQTLELGEKCSILFVKSGVLKASHQHTKMMDDVKARVAQVMNNEMENSTGTGKALKTYYLQ